ncbi:MAG: hypothetical protein ACLTZB_04680 [Streptococcus salivarius]
MEGVPAGLPSTAEDINAI